MTAGKKLKQLRKESGLTQSDVAKKIGVATQTIFKYENDIITNIPKETIEKLAEIFNVSPGYLLGWIDTEQETKNEKIADIVCRLREDDELLDAVNSAVLSYDLSEPTDEALTSLKKLAEFSSPPISDVLFKIEKIFAEQPSLIKDTITTCLQLNALGIEKVQEYIADLAENKKYTSDSDDEK